MAGRRAARRLAQRGIREIEEAVAQVQREPAPDPFTEEWQALSTEHLNEGHE